MGKYVVLALVLWLGTIGIVSADDLSILDGGFVSVKPNVLLILDNSKLMGNCIGTNNSNDANCDFNVKLKLVRDTLIDFMDTEMAQNINVGLMTFVKDSNAQGARIILPCGASPSQMKSKVRFIAGEDIIKDVKNGITLWGLPQSNSAVNPNPAEYPEKYPYYGQSNAPLAEGLAEAGLYFAGRESAYSSSWGDTHRYGSSKVDGVTEVNWYRSSQYVSPITRACQKNYIIYLTNGETTKSGASQGAYVKGMDSNNDGTTTLDEVSSYLYQNDMSAQQEGNQNIVTRFVSFEVGPDDVDYNKQSTVEARNLLTNAAKRGDDNVNGDYAKINTTDASQFKRDFLAVLRENLNRIIAETNSTYVAPVIPRSPGNTMEAGNSVYMAFFKPQKTGRWIGNLKRFGLVNGILMDASSPDPARATDANGNILDTAISYWSTEVDGFKVDFGGAGKKLAGNSSRNVYTFTGTGQYDLTNSANLFNAGNGDLTSKLSSETIASLLAGVVSYKRGDNTTIPNWRLGDIIHSEPLVKNFEATFQDGVIGGNEAIKSYLFVGANDGMLHVLNAADGSEVWAFVPPGQFSRLPLLANDTNHDYFVDGSPVIEGVRKSDGTIMQLLIFGERRGGKHYYALDVTNPDMPKWLYAVDDPLMDWNGNGVADGTSVTLGQSWAKPQLKRIKYHKDIYESFLLTGGYDDRLDADPNPVNALGRAIYAVKADSGALFGLNGLNINADNWKDTSKMPLVPFMTHPILDVTGFDKSRLGYMDRVYAGDLGGHMFAARYKKCSDLECTNDSWEPTVLFDLTSSGLGRKIMTRPEVVLEPGKECAYFGTGDRENPEETATVNAIYAVCNTWGETQPKPLKIDYLDDVTNNYVEQTNPDGTKKWTYASPTSAYGWYIRLTNRGEKLVSSPKLFNKKLYFTTFTPGTPPIDYDPCIAPYDFGVSRLYAVDYLTGAAAYNFNPDNVWTKEDRSKIIGTSIAGEPVFMTSGETTSLFYGSGGKFEGMPVETSPVVKRYYWRQLK